MTDAPLRVLVVGDAAASPDRLARHLREEGFEVEWRRVDDAEEMAGALDDDGWDLVFWGHELESVSEDGALALARLGPPTRRELREARPRPEGSAVRRYDLLFERSPDAIYVLSDDDEVLEANDALLHMFGVTRDELEDGIRPEAFYRDPADRERFLAELREKGFVEGMEIAMQRADGTPLVVLASGTVWKAPDGSVRGHQGMLTDITELTRTWEELRDQSAKLEERVKELGCLYAANELLRERDLDDPSTWRDFVRLIPPGWQFPEVTEACLCVEGACYTTDGWSDEGPSMSAPVETGADAEPGILEVAYTEERPEADRGPFLYEERELLDALALRVGESLQRRRAEEELRRREALFRTVVENSADVILILDRELDVLFRSPGGPGTLTYDPSVMEGVGVFERVHPDDREELEARLREMVDEGAPSLRTRYRILHPETDEVRHVEGAAVNLLDDPAVEGVVVNVRDVTERRRAEARLGCQADLLNAVGQAIIATDLEGRITFWGGGAEEVFGWSADEVMGRDVMEVTPAEEEADQASEIMERLRDGASWSGALEVRRKDGSTFPAIVTDHPLTDAGGRLTGIVGITTDISDLKDAQASMRRSEERFRALIEHSEDLIAILDPDGTIAYESPAVERVLGIGGSERVGRHALQDSVMHPEDQAEMEPLLEEVAAEEGASRPVRFRVRSASGEYRIIEGTLTNLTHLDAVGGIVMNGRDVTQRERLEEELYRAQRLEAVGRLAGGIAHDFNNIMTSIQGFTSVVLDELPPDDAHRDDLAEVLRQARRAAELTEQLLAFSRRQMLAPKVLDLRSTIRDMKRMLERLIGEDVVLSVEMPDDPLYARVDPGQLEQVLVNLTMNARDAMQDGGRLDVEARGVELAGEEARSRELEPGRYVEVTVEDTGHGMDEETLERAFEPFFTTRESGQGTGLGLATVFGVVKQSGGDVRVESEPGQGARFIILLPREEEPEGEASDEDAEVSGPEAVHRARPGESVMVAEDDDAVRELIERVLEKHGYRVQVAHDGEAALELLDDGAEPDVLLTDMVMPGIGGGELAERCRDLRPGMPVIFMTGYTEDEILRRGISENRENFLSKPFSHQEILTAVRGVLDGA